MNENRREKRQFMGIVPGKQASCSSRNLYKCHKQDWDNLNKNIKCPERQMGPG